MDAALVAQVRRFNRAVTQQVGALDDRYLASGRPLGEARVLWEAGAGGDGSAGSDGCDVRALRSRLGLDSGYLSRLLRSLERGGLVTVEPHDGDKRVRTVRLTPAGAAERARLDRRSDELAWSFLEPLDPAKRQRLVAAMDEVERLLAAALVEVEVVDPAHPTAQHCLREYYLELDRRMATGFDPGRALAIDPDEMRPPAGVFLVATLRGEPVGCGALKVRPGQPIEVKRMWVASTARGLGLGRRLLAELEDRAAAAGGTVVRLDTNSALGEAINLYESAGYRRVAAFNDEPHADRWFEKRLDDAALDR